MKKRKKTCYSRLSKIKKSKRSNTIEERNWSHRGGPKGEGQ